MNHSQYLFGMNVMMLVVVATDTAHRHVESHMSRHFPRDAHAIVSDVTGAYTQLNIQGPGSRGLMQALTGDSEDMSDAAFPFRAAKEVAIGYARPIVTRITYLGELGSVVICAAASSFQR